MMKNVKLLSFAIVSFVLLSVPAMAAMEMEEAAEIFVEFVVAGIAIFFGVLSISKISKTFGKESMMGKLANGFKSYVLITIVLEVVMIILWLYNEIVLGIALQPKGISEIGFIVLVGSSYYVLYKNISHFKSVEEKEFGGVTVEDLEKRGFIKARREMGKGLSLGPIGFNLIRAKK